MVRYFVILKAGNLEINSNYLINSDDETTAVAYELGIETEVLIPTPLESDSPNCHKEKVLHRPSLYEQHFNGRSCHIIMR